MRVWLNTLLRRIRRFTAFTGVGVSAFLLSEAMVTLGYTLFGRHLILVVELVSAFTSVTFGFTLNEKVTMRGVGEHGGGVVGFLLRLVKYQLVYALGSALSIALQLLLLYRLGVTPSIGNVVGSALALPVNYAVSSKVVWSVKAFSEE